MNLLASILNTLCVIALSILIASYLFAYSLKNRLHILAIALVLIAFNIITVITTVKLWHIVLFGNHMAIPVTWIRPTFLLLSLIFLIYTTWKRNDEK